MANEDTYVFFSPALAKLLDENNVDLGEIVRATGVTVPIDFKEDPARATCNARDRDLVSVLIASSAVILAATPVITRAIEAVTRRPVIAKELVLVPVEDSQRTLVTNSGGTPILHWVERSRVLSDNRPDKNTLAMKLTLPMGIKFEMREGDARDDG